VIGADVLIFDIALNVPAAGSNNSAVAVGTAVESRPPVTSIFPVCNNVAVCNARAVAILPVEEKFPVVASKISVVLSAFPTLSPPMTMTLHQPTPSPYENDGRCPCFPPV